AVSVALAGEDVDALAEVVDLRVAGEDARPAAGGDAQLADVDVGLVDRGRLAERRLQRELVRRGGVAVYVRRRVLGEVRARRDRVAQADLDPGRRLGDHRVG